ncbi:hypothetical protein ABPG77_008948 [Micractinium sp. CCAP 211/92]
MLVIFREITDLAEAAQSLDLSTENKPKGAKHQVRHSAMAQVADRTTILSEACALGEGVYRRVGELEAATDSDDLTTRLAGMPLNARWVSQADSLLIYRATKTACLLGSVEGDGFIISRLPSSHPSLIHWSAPLFVRIRLLSFGLSFGRQHVESFMPCMTSEMRRLLSGPSAACSVTGVEASINCGGLQHKADLIALPADSVGTVGMNHTSGVLFDLSLVRGGIEVDTAKNALLYGADMTPLQVLHGTVDAPREMQPLYGLLNAELLQVERVTPPARVSASLERYSTGFDPDRRVVLADGTVLYGDPTRRGGNKGKDA